MGTILRRFFVAELFPRFCLFYCQNHFSVVAKARWTNTCHFSKVPERQEMNNPFFRRQGVPYLGARFIRIYTVRTISFWLRCWQFWGNYMNSRTLFRADATRSSKKVKVCLLEEGAESRKIWILKMRTAVLLEIVDFLWNFFWIFFFVWSTLCCSICPFEQVHNLALISNKLDWLKLYQRGSLV